MLFYYSIVFNHVHSTILRRMLVMAITIDILIDDFFASFICCCIILLKNICKLNLNLGPI